MKILQVHKFYYDHRGAERYYFDVTKLLTDHGHTVIPFAMADGRNKPSEYSDYFTRRMDLSAPGYSWRSVKKIGKILYNKEAQSDIARLIQRTRPDVVHIHNIYNHLSPSILVACKHFNLPVVMTIHDFALLSPNYDLYRRGKIDESCKPHRYWQCVPKRCVKNSFGASTIGAMASYLNHWSQMYQKHVDVFIAPSQFVKEKFHQWQWSRAGDIAVVPHFSFPPAQKPRYVAGDYMLYAGGLTEGKGIIQLLEAIQKERIELPLKIAGDGPLYQPITELLNDSQLHWRVELLGQQSPAALSELMRQSRFVVVPSQQYETFGLTALEAFAARTPVLASNRGALPEIVDQAVGSLYHPDQPGGLGGAIRQLANNPQLPQLADAGYNRLLTDFAPALHYDRLMELYEQAKAQTIRS